MLVSSHQPAAHPCHHSSKGGSSCIDLPGQPLHAFLSACLPCTRRTCPAGRRPRRRPQVACHAGGRPSVDIPHGTTVRGRAGDCQAAGGLPGLVQLCGGTDDHACATFSASPAAPAGRNGLQARRQHTGCSHCSSSIEGRRCGSGSRGAGCGRDEGRPMGRRRAAGCQEGGNCGGDAAAVGRAGRYGTPRAGGRNGSRAATLRSSTRRAPTIAIIAIIARRRRRAPRRSLCRPCRVHQPEQDAGGSPPVARRCRSSGRRAALRPCNCSSRAAALAACTSPGNCGAAAGNGDVAAAGGERRLRLGGTHRARLGRVPPEEVQRRGNR